MPRFLSCGDHLCFSFFALQPEERYLRPSRHNAVLVSLRCNYSRRCIPARGEPVLVSLRCNYVVGEGLKGAYMF